MAAEDLGCRLGKDITGQTDPAAKNGKVPPDPIDGTCGLTGSIGKNGGTNPLGAPGKPDNGCETRGNRGPIPTKPEFRREEDAKTNPW